MQEVKFYLTKILDFNQTIFLLQFRLIMLLSMAVIIMLVLLDIISGNDFTVGNDPFSDSTFLLGHLIELDKISFPSEKQIPTFSTDCMSRPKIFIQVCSSRGNGIESALGYALLEIPTLVDGNHEIELPTWKPIPKEFMSRQINNLREYYFGTKKESFELMRNFFLRSGDRVKSNFFTETSGFVRVRVVKTHKPEYDRSSKGSRDSKKPIVVETIDEVISRVRRNRRERQLRPNHAFDIDRGRISEEKTDLSEKKTYRKKPQRLKLNRNKGLIKRD